MSKAETKNIIDEQDGYQFFSCYKCGELITCLELSRSLQTTGRGCRCGCMKVQPTEIKVEQYVQRNAVELAIYLKISEADYTADFILEASGLRWNRDAIDTGVETIRARFAELLSCS